MSPDNDHKTMNLKLIVWRQSGPDEAGRFEMLAKVLGERQKRRIKREEAEEKLKPVPV